MANILVEGLEVEVKQRSDTASKSIDKLVVSMQELRYVSTQVTNALRSISNELQNISSFSSQAKSVFDSFARTATKNAEKFASKISDAYKKATDSVVEFQMAIRKPSYSDFTMSDAQVPMAGFYGYRNFQQQPNYGYVPRIGKNEPMDFDSNFQKYMDSIRPFDIEGKDIGEVEGLEDLKEVVVKYKTDISGAIDGIKAKFKGLKIGHLLKALGRIALYRTLRTVIKEVSQAFREGIQNVARYSKAIGEIDSAKANYHMSVLATAVLKVKNSLGAMLAPIIQAVTPAIQNLANNFIEATNAINQFISAMQGKDVFTRAKDYWVDYAGELDNTTKSAGKLHKQLAGFDELNNLTTNSGSGSIEKDYSQMFEEVKINNKFMEQVDKLKENLGLIKTIAEGIVGAFVGFKLANWGSSLFSFLGGKDEEGNLFYTGAGWQFKAGLTLLISGLTVSFASGYDAGLNGSDFKSKLSTALGVIASTIGGAFIGFSIGGAIGAGVGAVIGLGLSLVINKLGFMMGSEAKAEMEREALKKKFLDSPAGRAFQEAEEVINSIAEWNVDAKVRLGDITGELDSDTFVKFVQAKSLIDSIFEIDSHKNLTKKEIEEINKKIKDLDALGLDGLNVTFDEATGHIRETKGEVYATINALLEQYKTQALGDAYVEALKLQYEAEQKVKEAQNAVTKATVEKINAMKELKQANDDVATAEKAYEDFMKNVFSMTAQEQIRYTKEHSDEIKILKENISKAKEAFELQSEAVRYATIEYNDANSVLDDVNGTLNDATAKVSELEGAIKNAQTSTTGWKSGLADLGGNLDILKGKASDCMTQVKNAVKEVGDGLQIGSNSLSPARQSLEQGTQVTLRANGGFVDSGQLFIANEAGAEMVGSIGGHTAVANNDQITTAIATATYSAMTKALAENNGTVNLVVEGDPNGMFKVMQKEAKSYTNRTGNYAFA